MNNLLLRRRMLMQAGGSPTPPTIPYQQVEYVYSTNNKVYCNLGITPNDTTVVQIKFAPTNNAPNIVIGYTVSNDRDDWRFFIYGGKAYYDALSNKRMNNFLTFTWNNVYELEFGNFYCKDLDSGTILAQSTQFTGTGVNTLYLNGMNTNSCVPNKWYYVKIYQNGSLVMDLYPIRDGTDGGLYDTISQHLFQNDYWEDYEFIPGPDIN